MYANRDHIRQCELLRRGDGTRRKRQALFGEIQKSVGHSAREVRSFIAAWPSATVAEMAALLTQVLVAAPALGAFPARVQSLYDDCLADSRSIDTFPDGLYYSACLMPENRTVPIDRRLAPERVLCPRVVSHEVAKIRSAHSTGKCL
jgi:hypothetical protein